MQHHSSAAGASIRYGSRLAGRGVVAVATAAAMWGCGDIQQPTAPEASARLASSANASPNADQAARDDVADQYIIQFKNDVRDVPGLAKQLVAQGGGKLGHTYTSVIKGFSAKLPAAAAAALQHNPNIELVEPDAIVLSDGGTEVGAPWNLDRLDQHVLPLNSTYSYASTGAGVTAYIIDTGLRYDHSEFEGRASFGFDYVVGGNGADCNGHGTHVAGTVGGKTYGVAKNVNLVAVRVMDCNGSGMASSVVAGMDWVAKNVHRPAVANISLGASKSSTLNAATEALVQAGVAVAVAAGNSGVDACGTSPASAPSAMTTGATTSTDERASYSNYGDCVDWFAPGSDITSAYFGSASGAASMSGTSMAAPHTAGAAALYLEAYPNSTPAQVRDALFAAATHDVVTNALSANDHLLYTLDFAAPTTPVAPPPPVNQLPVADYTFSCSNLNCSFTDGSTDADGSVASWSWAFGDNQSASGKSVAHAFAAAGTYSVKLTATDNLGGTGSVSKSVVVTVPPPPPPPSGISLTATGSKVKGAMQTQLKWSGATTTQVDVYRNNVVVLRVPNSGAVTDAIGAKGSGTYSYKVCESASTVCSAVKTVVF